MKRTKILLLRVDVVNFSFFFICFDKETFRTNIHVFHLICSDMSASTETSGIAEFYKRKSVFITGATGFIGKQLVEKLVRSCPGKRQTVHFRSFILSIKHLDIEHIYLLVRPKRGHDVNDRVKELLASPVSCIFISNEKS